MGGLGIPPVANAASQTDMDTLIARITAGRALLFDDLQFLMDTAIAGAVAGSFGARIDAAISSRLADVIVQLQEITVNPAAATSVNVTITSSAEAKTIIIPLGINGDADAVFDPTDWQHVWLQTAATTINWSRGGTQNLSQTARALVVELR